MFEIGQIKMLPDCVEGEQAACALPTYDLVFNPSGTTIVTADDLTFDLTGLDNVNPVILQSSADILAAGNFNEWISQNVKFNSANDTDPNFSVLFGFANENFDILNPLGTLTGNVILCNIVILQGLKVGNVISTGVPFAAEDFISEFTDTSTFDIANNEITVGIKRDGTAFSASVTTGTEVSSGYNDLVSVPAFTELYPIVVLNNLGAPLVNANITLNFDGADLTNSKPSTANPCGGSVNTLVSTATAACKTGQEVNYTPAGRTSQDDGGTQAGRLNKNSIYFDPASILGTGGTPWSGTYIVAGSTVVAWGTQSESVVNNCVAYGKLGLMANMGAVNAGFDLAWDDAGGNDDDIFAYCDAANTASLGGFSDWRVTNNNEIFAMAKYDAALSTEVSFPDGGGGNGIGALIDGLWSSTTYMDNTDRAYVLEKDGELKRRNKGVGGSNFAVILVRDLTLDSV